MPGAAFGLSLIHILELDPAEMEKRNIHLQKKYAEKGIVTKGLRCDCFLMLRRYEDKIGFIE